MALIQCPDCKAEISDQAPACPKCGHPFAKKDNGPSAASPSILKIVLKVILILIGLYVLFYVVVGLFMGTGTLLLRHYENSSVEKFQAKKISDIVEQETKVPDSIYDLGTIDVNLSWPGTDQRYINTHIVLKNNRSNLSLEKEIQTKTPQIREIAKNILAPTSRNEIGKARDKFEKELLENINEILLSGKIEKVILLSFDINKRQPGN